MEDVLVYLRAVTIAFFALLAPLPRSLAAEAPKLVQKDGRYALMVDGLT